ncbi:MAG: FHA domain-containing protein [Myxococcales bacterium]|nr:MAG: FHA domain-containing protein [Myxococcales bacterium]
MRYRLRFHLQEVDLTGEEVVIGRGSMCHVTIEDPMLSRRHVLIDLGGHMRSI